MSVVKKVVKFAIPVIATVALGPAGAGLVSSIAAGAIGGAIGGVVSGGGLKGALLGAATGGGAAWAGGKLGSILSGPASSAPNPVTNAATKIASNAGANSLPGISGLTAQTAQTGGMQSLLGQSIGSGATGAASINAAGQQYLANNTFGGTGNIAQSLKTSAAAMGPTATTKSLGQQLLGGAKQFMAAADLNKVIGAGVDYYGGRQQENIAKELSKINIQDKAYADAYRAEGQRGLDRLRQGGLPEQYDDLLRQEEERISRQLVAQGYNPTESGKGQIDLANKMGLLKAELLRGEQSYYTGVMDRADNFYASQRQAQAAAASSRASGRFMQGRAVGTLGSAWA